MGDGDCGEAVRDASKAILKTLDNGIAESGSIFAVIHAIIDAVDSMGGTLGAILGILLAALATSLRQRTSQTPSASDLISIFAPALSQAVESLKSHTGARVGDRTVMDVLIPFAETLDGERDFGKAVKTAKTAADKTRDLKPSFGRASYVALTDGEEQKVPDPGAWALMEIVSGLYEGFGKH